LRFYITPLRRVEHETAKGEEKMKKIYLILMPLALLALLLAGCGQKESRFEAIQDAGKIVVGTSADYEPWEYKDEADEFVGIDMEIMREIGKRMGVEVEFQDMAFDTLVAAVESGKIDCVIAAMGATDERKEKVDFSEVYYAGKNAMVAMKDSGITIGEDGLDAANYKLGTQSGTLMAYWIDENLIEPGLMDEANVLLYERADQVFLDLQAGRIDIGISDVEPAKTFLSTEPNAEIVWTGAMDPAGQAIAIMKGESELKAEIDKQINAMLDDGSIQQILDEYGVE
jgi:polar amino acid transport system substrate-binding protein